MSARRLLVANAAANPIGASGHRADCYSVSALAKHWHCSPRRVREYVRRGILSGFMIGRAMRFSPDAVVEAQERLAAPASRPRRRRVTSEISPTVRSILGLDA